MCIPAPESTTSSLSSGSLIYVTCNTHSSVCEKNVAFSFFLKLVCFWQDSTSCFGHMGPVLKMSQRRGFVDEDFWLVFFKAMVLSFSRILAWRSLDFVNRTFSNGSQDFMHRVSAGTFLFEKTNASESCKTPAQLWHNFSQLPRHSCRRFLFHCGNGNLWLCLVVHQPCDAGGSKLLTSTLQIKSARFSKNGTMVTFASDTSFLRHTSTSLSRMAQKVWRQCVQVFWARSLLSCRKLHRSPFEHWLAFFDPLVTSTFSSFFNSPVPGVKVS